MMFTVEADSANRARSNHTREELGLASAVVVVAVCNKRARIVAAGYAHTEDNHICSCRHRVSASFAGVYT